MPFLRKNKKNFKKIVEKVCRNKNYPYLCIRK